MRVKSELFVDEKLPSLIGRIESVLELLINNGETIISVNLLDASPILYKGVIFYKVSE